MALRLASILGACCWSWQPWHVLGEVEREFFPLSGGIDNGVHVTIAAKAVQGTGAKIEFVDRERKTAFAFELQPDAPERQIVRSSEFANVEQQTFGGWPAGLETGAQTFVFTKRKFGIAVSIMENNVAVRYPWYDFAGVQENGEFPLLTHVAVSSGLTDAEVTLERPECNSQCHPDECRGADGTSVCTEAGGCYSVVAGSAAGVAASCAATKTTAPGGSGHCCDGDAVTPRLRSTLPAGRWAVVSSNADYLLRVCNAFNIAGAQCPHQPSTAAGYVHPGLAGQLVQILPTPAPAPAPLATSSASETFSVFAPSFMQSTTANPDHNLEDGAKFNLPPFALFELFGNAKITRTLPPHGTGDMWVDRFHRFIVTVGSNNEIVPEGIKVGQYVDFVRFDFGKRNRTVRMNRRSELYARGRDSTYFISDIPVETPAESCTDLEMLDVAIDEQYAGGNNCAAYSVEGSEWCLPSGYPTEAGCQALGYTNGLADETCRLPDGKDVETDASIFGGSAAAILCCKCGGGNNVSPPAGWEANAPDAPTEAPGQAEIRF